MILAWVWAFNLNNAELFCMNHGADFFQFEINIIVLLTLPDSFEYICHGSTAIINSLLFQCGVNFRRQNLTSTSTSEVAPRAVIVKTLTLVYIFSH